MHILVIDVGGTNAKVWKTGEDDKLKIPTGKEFSPQKLVEEVRLNVSDWDLTGFPSAIPVMSPTGTLRRKLPIWDQGGWASITRRRSAVPFGS